MVRYSGYSTEYEFKHVYNLDKLKEYSTYCENDIKRAMEYIAAVKKHQEEIFNHAQIVANTAFEYVVIIERTSDYRSNKKHYHVKVHHRPKGIDRAGNNFVYGKYSHQKNFEGKERHAALKYAADLAEQYNCSIERKGFPRN